MNESNQILTRYLLGELSDADCSALEQRYLADPALFDQIVEVENELVDGYARGRLEAETRQRFESYYLKHSRRRERAVFAEALVAKADSTRLVPASIPEVAWWRRLTASIPR